MRFMGTRVSVREPEIPVGAAPALGAAAGAGVGALGASFLGASAALGSS